MSPDVLALFVLAAPLAFAFVAVASAFQPGPRPRWIERLSLGAAGLGVPVAALAGVLVARHGGLLESPALGAAGLGLSIRLDPLSAVMLGMIALLALAIVRFSATYLDGDARQGAFLGRLAATLAAVEVLVLAGNLGLLVSAWVATSLALHRLLLFYPARRRAVIAARKKFIAARLGDVALVAAAALLYRHAGTGNLEAIFDALRAAPAAGWTLGAPGAAALCLAVAALLKSAQFPTHGWLVEVMETPTPVSALLHAGILNAGPFLAIRLAFVLEGAAWAQALLIVVGGFTALFASTTLLTQPAVKVALGYSSAAHMGFMLMVCGFGVYPAALLHLVAHSFYKAHAFLASGSVVDEARAAKVALPRRLGQPLRVAGSLGVAVGVYAGFAWLWGIDLRAEPALVALGAILVMGLAQIVAPALDSDGPLAGTARAGGLALGVATAFFGLEAGAQALLHPVLPAAAAPGLVRLGLMALAVTAFAAVVLAQILGPARPTSPRGRRLAVHLRNGLYANALFDRLVGALDTPRQPADRAAR